MTDFQSIASSYRDSVLQRSRVPINGIRTLGGMRKRERSPFGVRLKQAREKAGLTQPQLAEAVGMGQSTLAEAEGVGNSSSFTVRIAQRCGVSALWLESGDGDMLDSSTWPFTEELLAYVNSLTTDGLVKLEGVMRAHLGMAPISAQSLHDLSTQPSTDQSETPTNAASATKSSTVLDNARYQGGKSAGSKAGGLQKPRSGRSPKRAA